MSNITQKSQVSVLGIDLAKNSFQLHGVNKSGELSGQIEEKYMGAY